MVFSSLTFLYLFLPATLIVYFLVPKRARNFVLMLTGFVFYAWGEPKYILLMTFTIFIDYTCGRLMARFDQKDKWRMALLVSSVAINLLLLGIFKYNSFVVNNINAVFGSSIVDPKIALPIGISFYTFQSMSYTIDLYRRKVPVQRNFIDYAAYVSMFPQLVAGPIVRYDDVRRELEERKLSVSGFGDGVGIFVQGLAKKVLLANNIGMLWTTIKAVPQSELSVASAWLGILAFTFQIYFDFSGYSDMAVGMGKMLGFNFPQNFNYPYMATSVTDFWRRWHITLSTWFKEYVYIPLGGNRVKLPRLIFNLMVVWMLTGLWHGASWNFVLWGLYYGILLVFEKMFFGKILARIPAFFTRIYTFVLVMFGWVLFEMNTLPEVWGYFGAMFGTNGRPLIDTSFKYWFFAYVVVLVLCIIFSTDLLKRLTLRLYKSHPAILSVSTVVIQVAFVLVCTAYLVDATYNPFLYFRF